MKETFSFRTDKNHTAEKLTALSKYYGIGPGATVQMLISDKYRELVKSLDLPEIK